MNQMTKLISISEIKLSGTVSDTNGLFNGGVKKVTTEGDTTKTESVIKIIASNHIIAINVDTMITPLNK